MLVQPVWNIKQQNQFPKIFAFPLIKLSQFSTNPAKIHYETVISIFQYLHATRDKGITYWRSEPHPQLPQHEFPTYQTTNYTTTETTEIDESHTLHGAVDSDWADDMTHRRSITGIVLKLAGGTIYYKTKVQDTIAQSTTEAEFTAACDAGKAIMYIRSILDEIDVPQESATALYIDNNGALLMGNAQKPTRRTRHMDIKKFVLSEWIQQDLILLKRISTSNNYADGMTKQTPRQLFYRHFDYIMGNIPPDYTCHNTIETNMIKHSKNEEKAIIKSIISDSQKSKNVMFAEHGEDNIL